MNFHYLISRALCVLIFICSLTCADASNLPIFSINKLSSAIETSKDKKGIKEYKIYPSDSRQRLAFVKIVNDLIKDINVKKEIRDQIKTLSDKYNFNSKYDVAAFISGYQALLIKLIRAEGRGISNEKELKKLKEMEKKILDYEKEVKKREKQIKEREKQIKKIKEEQIKQIKKIKERREKLQKIENMFSKIVEFDRKNNPKNSGPNKPLKKYDESEIKLIFEAIENAKKHLKNPHDNDKNSKKENNAEDSKEEDKETKSIEEMFFNITKRIKLLHEKNREKGDSMLDLVTEVSNDYKSSIKHINELKEKSPTIPIKAHYYIPNAENLESINPNEYVVFKEKFNSVYKGYLNNKNALYGELKKIKKPADEDEDFEKNKAIYDCAQYFVNLHVEIKSIVERVNEEFENKTFNLTDVNLRFQSILKDIVKFHLLESKITEISILKGFSDEGSNIRDMLSRQLKFSLILKKVKKFNLKDKKVKYNNVFEYFKNYEKKDDFNIINYDLKKYVLKIVTDNGAHFQEKLGETAQNINILFKKDDKSHEEIEKFLEYYSFNKIDKDFKNYVNYENSLWRLLYAEKISFKIVHNYLSAIINLLMEFVDLKYINDNKIDKLNYDAIRYIHMLGYKNIKKDAYAPFEKRINIVKKTNNLLTTANKFQKILSRSELIKGFKEKYPKIDDLKKGYVSGIISKKNQKKLAHHTYGFGFMSSFFVSMNTLKHQIKESFNKIHEVYSYKNKKLSKKDEKWGNLDTFLTFTKIIGNDETKFKEKSNLALTSIFLKLTKKGTKPEIGVYPDKNKQKNFDDSVKKYNEEFKAELSIISTLRKFKTIDKVFKELKEPNNKVFSPLMSNNIIKLKAPIFFIDENGGTNIYNLDIEKINKNVNKLEDLIFLRPEHFDKFDSRDTFYSYNLFLKNHYAIHSIFSSNEINYDTSMNKIMYFGRLLKTFKENIFNYVNFKKSDVSDLVKMKYMDLRISKIISSMKDIKDSINKVELKLKDEFLTNLFNYRVKKNINDIQDKFYNISNNSSHILSITKGNKNFDELFKLFLEIMHSMDILIHSHKIDSLDKDSLKSIKEKLESYLKTLTDFFKIQEKPLFYTDKFDYSKIDLSKESKNLISPLFVKMMGGNGGPPPPPPPMMGGNGGPPPPPPPMMDGNDGPPPPPPMMDGNDGPPPPPGMKSSKDGKIISSYSDIESFVKKGIFKESNRKEKGSDMYHFPFLLARTIYSCIYNIPMEIVSDIRRAAVGGKKAGLFKTTSAYNSFYKSIKDKIDEFKKSYGANKESEFLSSIILENKLNESASEFHTEVLNSKRFSKYIIGTMLFDYIFEDLKKYADDVQKNINSKNSVIYDDYLAIILKRIDKILSEKPSVDKGDSFKVHCTNLYKKFLSGFGGKKKQINKIKK